MADIRERRPRGRRKVRFEEVLPSTDLPPLVQGDLRCFLVVDIGKIIWSSTATAQVPPASPAYVRLRWWGETSDGTLFKPSSSKKDKAVKSRCRFGVRSGTKQMCAYFVDMGSIVLEVLTSPKSVPLGQIQIPKVASLSSSNPIRDFFPIFSPSSRKIGELQIHIRFKSLEGAYDVTTDTGTGTSMSSRSRPPSEVGRRSRSRGSSAGSRSNRGSARSRSSSAGSRKSGRRKRSITKGRRRSRSTESNASSASKNSHSVRKASTIDSSTPRGVDDLLKQNGHDFYGNEEKPSKKSSIKNPRKETKKKGDDMDIKSAITTQADAISVLLQRGNRLREDILRSQLEPEVPKSQFETRNPSKSFISTVPPQAFVHEAPPTQPPTVQAIPPPQMKTPKTIAPIKERRQDLDMRFVDLVFGSQEFKGHSAMFSDFDSHMGSPLSSMISELSDNPLYDDSLLQQMFYDNAGPPSFYNARMNEKLREFENGRTYNTVPSADQNENKVRIPKQPRGSETSLNTRIEKLAHRAGITAKRLVELNRVRIVRVAIETLTITQHDSANLNKSRSKKGHGRGSKPPVPSPKGKRKNGTYFVEFRFPESTHTQRDHPSSMTTSHDVTRVASRRVTTAGTTTVVFDECYEFRFEFSEENLIKWSHENMEYAIYCRKPTDKKALPVGVAKLDLHKILKSPNNEIECDIDVVNNSSSCCGKLKVFVELVSEVHEIQSERNQHDETDVSVMNEIDSEREETPAKVVKDDEEAWRSSIALSPSTSVLYMMIIVQEGTDIPGTTVISPTHGMTSHPPNVSLVCRTLTSGNSEKTPVIWGQNNPRFDFVQISHLKLDNTLLSRMENNVVIIEVWTKITSSQPHSDKLLGLVKLPTHHFAQSLKDDEIASVVLKSQHPLISVDEPVPIIDLFTGQERGHLQVTLALGTREQISNLRKIKAEIQGKRVKQHHLDDKKSTDSDHKMSGPVEHTFEVNIVKLNGFKPHDNQVWGETDCFIQYQFPKQKNLNDNSESTNENGEINTQNLDLASMENYRSDATLCVPNPVFNDARRHAYHPPPSVPVQRILLSCCYSDGLSGGIPFELWSRYYHPNVRDQILAKGMLPVAKIGALVSMTNKKISDQTFHIPMEFVEAEQSHDNSAGRLEVHIKYKASGTTLEQLQPPMQIRKPVILRVGLLRACGLKAAATIACRHGNDDDMKYCADVGVNTYVEIKPSFLPDEETRVTRIIAQNFAPEYQHHFEISCPLVSYHRDITPVSLAELMVSGEMEFTVWHRPADNEQKSTEDRLLAKLSIPVRSLLHKTSGLHSWFALKSSDRNRKIGEECATVGGLEISMSFSGTNDLDTIIKAANATGWSLPHFESRLLSDDVIDDITGTDCVTFAVTVTNAWIPKNDTYLCGRTDVDKNANVYLRYKFFDHDSVTSSMCPLVSKQPHSIDTRFENLISARLAHKKSFICKRSRPLNYYLREERLELQLWLTHSKGSKKSRPLDVDKLLGSCYLDLTTIEQHISGSFDIFKAGADDLGSGQVRVYVSMKPGDIVDPIPDPILEQISSEEEKISDVHNVDSAILPKQMNESVFSAVVTVDRAMHLSLVHDLESDKPTEPNCFVSFDIMDETVATKNVDDIRMVTVATRIAMMSSGPVWTDRKEVFLPKTLLSGTRGALLLKVWHRDRLYMNSDPADLASSQQEPKPTQPATDDVNLMATDRMLGFATVDLSVLRAGLRDVNGWYNVLDIHGQCQGQLKVAVTPTSPQEASQPETARSSETILSSERLPPLGSKGVNFLHQAPIDVPIQTPSGSMYIPGLQRSAQTVPLETRENAFLGNHDNQQNFLPTFSQHFLQNQSIHHGPSASMFRYSSSDQQQASLVNTLEKQIKELEEIKTRFEHRRAAGFQQTDDSDNKQHKILSDSVATSSRTYSQPHAMVQNHDITVLTTPRSQAGMNFSSRPLEPISDAQLAVNDSFLKLQPDGFGMPDSENASTDFKMKPSGRSKTKSTISSHSASEIISNVGSGSHVSSESKTVHLSLYEVKKDAEFDDRALSENEVTSGVEFVQPRSLNESVCSDLPQNVSKTPENVNFEKPPFLVPQNRGKHPYPDPSALTPGRSEGHSVLDETSLWLSGSTLRVSGFSSEDEDFQTKMKPDVTNNEEMLQLTPRKENGCHVEPNEKAEIFEEDTHLKQIRSSPPPPESGDEKRSGDDDVTTAQILQPTQEKSENETYEKENEEQNEHSHSEDNEVKVINEPTSPPEDPSVPKNESDRMSEQDLLSDSSTNGDVSSISELSESEEPEQSQGSKSRNVTPELIPDAETEDTKFETELPNNKVLQVENEPPAHKLNGEAMDDETITPPNNIPQFDHARPVSFNLSKQEQLQSNSKSHAQQKRLFPSFFPPTKNLEASMRALQEATLKHKHDLLKRKEEVINTDENQPRSTMKTKVKPKKILPKPTDVTDEKTQRLARIFRTKFS